MPDTAIGYLKVLYSVIRAGYAAGITAGVEKATGKQPIAFREFALLNASAWKRCPVRDLRNPIGEPHERSIDRGHLPESDRMQRAPGAKRARG
jgi:hypothetical protein